MDTDTYFIPLTEEDILRIASDSGLSSFEVRTAFDNRYHRTIVEGIGYLCRKAYIAGGERSKKDVRDALGIDDAVSTYLYENE